MREWIMRLKNAIETEHGDRPAVMTLATVTKKGSPRARSIICRKIADDGAIWLTSDARSKKGGQIRNDSRVELVVWLPTLRRQYRLRGKGKIVDRNDSTAIELWRALPRQSQAMFFWPSMDELSASVNPPDTFEAIVIYPEVIEELDLTVEPHRRKRWSSKPGKRE